MSLGKKPNTLAGLHAAQTRQPAFPRSSPKEEGQGKLPNPTASIEPYSPGGHIGAIPLPTNVFYRRTTTRLTRQSTYRHETLPFPPCSFVRDAHSSKTDGSISHSNPVGPAILTSRPISAPLLIKS